MQKTHSVFDLNHLLFAELPRIILIVISFEIEHISLNDQLGLILNFFQILDPLTLFLITALSTLSMLILSVVCQTQPAKLVLTFETSHVIAALVFLDRSATFWTRFSEGLHPRHVF